MVSWTTIHTRLVIVLFFFIWFHQDTSATVNEGDASSTNFLRLSRDSSDSRDECATDREILGNILAKYNRHPLPGGGDVGVELEMWVQDISRVSASDREFEAQVYLNEKWIDPGLRFDHLKPCKSNLTLDHSIDSMIWKPDITFVNSKSVIVEKSPLLNLFIMVFPNGTIWRNQRLKIVGSCEPSYDNKGVSCHLTLESYTYNADEVKVRWAPRHPTLLLKNLNLPGYCLNHMSTSKMQARYSAGWWDELTATFKFRQCGGWHLVRFSIPTGLMVLLAIASIALHGQICARLIFTGILLMAVVVLSGFATNVRKEGLQATDTWALTAISFIVAAAIETIIVASIDGWARSDDPNSGTSGEQSYGAAPDKPLIPPDSSSEKKKFKFGGKWLRMIDFVSMIALLLCFVLFVIIYCSREF